MTNSTTLIYSRQLIYVRDLLYVLVVRDIKLRYKRSILGLGWSLLNPLARLLVFQFVFGVLMAISIPHYATFVFIGILAWGWFESSLLSATGAIVDNRDLIKRPGFPVATLPLISVTSELIHFLLAVPMLLIVLVVDGVQLTSAILTLPLLTLLQFILTLSLAYLVAVLQVFFGDTKYLLGIILNLLFFSSGIFFDINQVSEIYHPFLRLNPMVQIIEAYRAILIGGELPSFPPLFIVGLLAISVLWLGYRSFLRAGYHFVEEL